MFTSSSRRAGVGNPNRWLLLAGIGLLALGFVLRLMMDVGRADGQAAGVAVNSLQADSTLTDSALAESPPAASPPADSVMESNVQAGAAPADTSPPSPPQVTARPGNGQWMVQLGVFSTQANAARVVERARALGFTAQSAPVGAAGRYRVRVPGFESRESAKAAADSLGRGLGIAAVVLAR